MIKDGLEYQTDIRIETATSGDIAAVAELHRKAFKLTYPEFPQLHTPEEDLAHFKEVFAKDKVYVAKQGAKVVAYCAFGNGWLRDLYVDAEFQGRKLGTTLLNQAKLENDALQLWTFQINQNARTFYEQNGFQKVEETDGTNNEEKQPDICYRWQKDNA